MTDSQREALIARALATADQAQADGWAADTPFIVDIRKLVAALRASAPPEGTEDAEDLADANAARAEYQERGADGLKDYDTYRRERSAAPPEGGQGGGITSPCIYCHAPGFVYHHADGYNIALCDAHVTERKPPEGGQGAADLDALAVDTLAKVKASMAKAEHARGYGPAVARADQLSIILAALRRAAPAVTPTLERLVADLQAHAREHGWQDVDEPIAALLAYPAAPPEGGQGAADLDAIARETAQQLSLTVVDGGVQLWDKAERAMAASIILAALRRAAPAVTPDHTHEFREYMVCRICGRTEADIAGECHHCGETQGRCWWCLRAAPAVTPEAK